MTYESEQKSKVVEQAISRLAVRAKQVAFAEAELERAHETVKANRDKVDRERGLYDTELEKVLELFPALGRGFKPEPISKTVTLGEDGMIHVVEADKEGAA